MKSPSPKAYALVKIVLTILTLVLVVCPSVIAQSLPAPSSGRASADNLSPKDSISSERSSALEQITTLTTELQQSVSPEREGLENIRLRLNELISIFDMHLIALSEAEKLDQGLKSVDKIFEQRLGEWRKGKDLDSFFYLLRLEDAVLLSDKEVLKFEREIEHKQEELKVSSKLANELARELRLEREKENLSEEQILALRVLEIREQVARARSAIARVEIENLNRRRSIEEKCGQKLESELEQRRSSIKFTEPMLKELIGSLEKQLEKTSAEMEQRQQELNQELAKTSTLDDNFASNFSQLYSELLGVYVNLLRIKQKLLEFSKHLYVARFELRNGVLTTESARDIQDKIRRIVQTANGEVAADHGAISGAIEDFAALQERFRANSGIAEANDKFRSVIRATLLALSDIGITTSSMKSLADSRYFVGGIENRAWDFMRTIWEARGTIWNFEVFVIDDSPITIGKLFLALLLFVIGVRLSRAISFRAHRQLITRFHLDAGAAVAVETIAFYALIVLSAVIALHFVRIPLTIFTLAGGALAIGVGFGSQTIVKNFFSGLILLLERPIRVGDVIQYDATIGMVSKIGTRSTVLLTGDQLEVIVPNSYLIENTVTNWTLTSNRMRRKINVGVAYGSPLREVGQVILAQAEKHNLVLKDPEPDVIFADFADSTLNFTLRFWVQIGTGVDPIKVESDLRHMIDGAFREAGIEIAFPQRDMNFTAAEPIKIQLVQD